MSRARRLVGLLAALFVTVVALLPGTAAFAADPRLVITSVQTGPGTVSFVLMARNLPQGTVIDPTAVRVTVSGTVLRSETRAAPAEAPIPPRALVAVLDLTQSNSATEVASAKAALGALAAALPADVKLGLVTVTGAAKLDLAPTVDRGAFTRALAAANPSGFAALVGGVVEAIDALGSGGFAEGDQRILLVSSGVQTNSGLTDVAQQENLTGHGIPVDVLAVSPTSLGTARLRAYADATQGRLATATDTNSAVAGVGATAATFPPVFAVTAFVPGQFADTSSTLDVSAAGVTGSSLVRFGPALPGPRQEVAPPSTLGWIPSWAAYVLAGIVFLAVGGGALAVAWPRSATSARIRQIEHFGPARSLPAVRTEPTGSAGSAIARTAIAATATVVGSGRLEERLSTRLERAGMKMRPEVWVLVRALITVGTGVLLFALTDWIGAILGLIIGWFSTVLYQMVRVERRARVFSEQLPDALQLVIGSLKSGFSLPQALESLVRESPDPVGSEFGRALAEHHLGVDVSDALEGIAQRTGSEDLGWAVMAVRIQREVGGNLAEVLQTTVDTMRERGRLRRHVSSLSAEGRLSAWVLIGLPVVLGLFMFFYRRDYMEPLFTDSLGITMLLGGGALFVVGIIWMARVIRVEA